MLPKSNNEQLEHNKWTFFSNNNAGKHEDSGEKSRVPNRTKAVRSVFLNLWFMAHWWAMKQFSSGPRS